MWGRSTETTLWQELSRRCHLREDFAKICAYCLLYGGSIDPWLDSIVRAELDAIALERGHL